MPIREESFRIGCGRYIQGRGYISRAGEEVRRVGSAPLVIGDDTTLALTRRALEQSLSAECNKYEFVVHNGTCNEGRAGELAAYALAGQYDVIIGVGGGVLMDFAKLTAHRAGLPVINIPTSSATCASYASLSVRYTPEGQTVGSLHYKREVDAVIADTEILAAQPIRLFLAGVFDALAKYVEIKQRFSRETVEYPIGLDYAFVMSERSYQVLNEQVPGCLQDMEAGLITDRLEQVLFTCIAATGAISGIARGSNQTALAHKFYETTRTMFPESARPYLHGEIVGVGLLLQNYFNGEIGENTALIKLMKQYHRPYRVTDVGVERTEAVLQEYYRRLCKTSAIDEDNAEEYARLERGLRYLWEIS